MSIASSSEKINIALVLSYSFGEGTRDSERVDFPAALYISDYLVYIAYSNFISIRPICVFLLIRKFSRRWYLADVRLFLQKVNALHTRGITLFHRSKLKVRSVDRRLPVDLGYRVFDRGFSLMEMLTVLAIVSILAATSAQLVPLLFRANQVDVNVVTLSGILEQAREAAVSNDTFVWVAFTGNANNTGTWVATLQSQDGTDSIAWATTGIAVPGTPTLVQLLNKLQNLPGVTIVDASSSALPALLTSQASAVGNATPLFEPSGMQWTVTPLQNTSAGPGIYFTHAIEFAPDGEAHVPGTSGTWYSNIQFGLIPTKGVTSNAQLFNVSRVTGKVTVYRP